MKICEAWKPSAGSKKRFRIDGDKIRRLSYMAVGVLQGGFDENIHGDSAAK